MGDDGRLTDMEDRVDAGLVVGIVFIGALVLIVVAAVLSHRNKTTKRVSILEFQRGVKFVDGVFATVLQPGAYRIKPTKERVEVVDLRPQPILIEGFAFKDADQKDWTVSLGCSLLVEDAYTSISKLKNQVNDCVAIMRDALRKAVVGVERGFLSDRDVIRKRLQEEMNRELKQVGMRVEKLEVTELWSQMPDQREVGFAKA